jgi:hypothetical protein
MRAPLSSEKVTFSPNFFGQNLKYFFFESLLLGNRIFGSGIVNVKIPFYCNKILKVNLLNWILDFTKGEV